MVRFALAAALILAAAGIASAQQDPVEGGRRGPRKPKPAIPMPTETDLGVPLYPGARFDGALSGGMTQPDQKAWLFFSDDAPSRVLAFYEQKTGKKAQSWEKDKYLLTLAGKSPVPEHGVAIETLEGNAFFQGKGKTVITVSRANAK